jgi:hypothetical protein
MMNSVSAFGEESRWHGLGMFRRFSGNLSHVPVREQDNLGV